MNEKNQKRQLTYKKFFLVMLCLIALITIVLGILVIYQQISPWLLLIPGGLLICWSLFAFVMSLMIIAKLSDDPYSDH